MSKLEHPKVTWSVTQEEAEVVLQALSGLPYGQVSNLFQRLQIEAVQQLQSATATRDVPPAKKDQNDE